MDGVRALPPTEREEDSRVWGPHIADDSADLYWKVRIDRTEPGRYAWVFSLRVGDDGDWISFFTGDYLAGFDPSESQGSFLYDLDKLAEMGASADTGTIAVEYDYIGEHKLYADITQDGVSGDYWYRFEDGVASAWLVLPVDVYDDANIEKALLEDYSVAAQWLESGAGRLDSHTTGGDFGLLEVFYTECWDDTGTIVYTENTCDICTEPATGTLSDCALSVGLDPLNPPH